MVGPFASAFKAGVVGRIAARVAIMASGEDRLQFPLLLAVEVRTLAWEVAGAVLLATAAAGSLHCHQCGCVPHAERGSRP